MAVKLNAGGEAHLNALIAAGNYTTDKSWDFSAEDGNALLGDAMDWARYSSVHLGEDEAASDKTKARWKYPAAKAKGTSEEVYRSGLIAAKERASQQNEDDIAAAAQRLIDAIDKKSGKEASAEAAKAGAKSPLGTVRDLPRLMTRIFGTPLMIAPDKLEIILAAIGPRLGVASEESDRLKAFFDDGDDETEQAHEGAPYDLTSDGIALIPVDGTLVYKSSWLGAVSGLTGYGDIRAALDAALGDPKVRALLIEVDSNGGEVNGCFDLCDAIFAARAVKPIYAVAADDAFSAAYALAASASRLYASRTSGLGSVGVVACHVDQSGADAAEGLKYSYVYSGAHKVDGNPHGALSASARSAIQANCDRLRALFAASVARYRGLSLDAVMKSEAACYFGEEAVAKGFADAIGTPADALGALRAHLAALDSVASSVPLAAVPGGAPFEARATPGAPGTVIDLAAMRERGGAEARAHALEIIEMCALAGMPHLARELIAEDRGVEAARARLLQLKAEASDALEMKGRLMPDAGINGAQQAQAGWDKAFAPYMGQARKG